MTFPLIGIPKRVVYVDDKGSFLEALRRTMPRTHARQFITSPAVAVERLTYEIDCWRNLEKLLNSADDALDEPVGLLTKMVQGHFSSPDRFHLTSVLIVDYSMPGLTGLDLIRRLGAWPGRKLLLTGEADSTVAIGAFNEGLIQKFIPKGSHRLYNVLKASFDEMHEVVCEQVGQLIRPYLTTWQKDLLHDDRVDAALRAKIQELEWSEYVVIGRPFGLLGLSHTGPLQWLQLETAASLAALAELISEQGCDASDVRAVRAGVELANSEVHHELNLPGRISFREAEVIVSNPDLYCAVFDLVTPVVTSAKYGIDDIMSPLEEMRSLLRDVTIALDSPMAVSKVEPGLKGADAGSRGDEHGRVDAAYRSISMARLAAVASRSMLHENALAMVLEEVSASEELRAYIHAGIALARAGAHVRDD